MLRGYKLMAVALCVVSMAGLSGCAETIYPSLPDLGGIGKNLLTPKEQEQAIKDLSAEQQTHGDAAAKAIEKRE